ncbi:MAG: hypothetical protein V1844_12315 [Pseudomonadota bacterium]
MKTKMFITKRTHWLMLAVVACITGFALSSGEAGTPSPIFFLI